MSFDSYKKIKKIGIAVKELQTELIEGLIV